jgi:hypothetical protein
VGSRGAAATTPGSVDTVITNVLLPQNVSWPLVSARVGRVAIQISTTTPNASFHVHPHDSAAGLTDPIVYPGETFSFPAGVAYTGPVYGYSTNAPPPLDIVVVEYYLVPEAGTM